MIKQLVSQLLLLIDSGKLMKTPIKWLYVLIGLFCFVPAIAFVVCLFVFWDFFIGLVGGNFWTNFVSIFIFILFFYSLIIFGLIGYHYWLNRRNNLDAIIKTGSRIVVIPLVADVNQSLGEVNSIFMVFATAVAFVLAYLACLLTNGFGFYTEWGFIWMLFGGALGVAVVALLAYLNVLLVRFFSEKLRLLPLIGNDVHHLATSDKKELAREADGENVKFVCPKFTPSEKKVSIGAIIGAVVVALVAAFCLSIGNTIAMNKSIYKQLDEKRVLKLNKEYWDFSTFYTETSNAAQEAERGDAADKYAEIKYKRLYKFQHEINSDGNREELREKAEKDYMKQYVDPHKAAVETELAKWEQFIADNDPEPYLTVTAHTGNYRQAAWYSYYDRPQWFFSIEQPKGALSDASVTVKILNSNGKNYRTWTQSLADLKKINNDATARFLTDVDNPYFWDSHSMVVVVNSITIDGKTISGDAMKQVPASAKAYEADPTMMNKITFIRECIDTKVPDYDEWINQQIEDNIKAKDELCYEFAEKYMR